MIKQLLLLVATLFFSSANALANHSRCPIYVGEVYKHFHKHHSGSFEGHVRINSARLCGNRKICYEGDWTLLTSNSIAKAIGTIQGNQFEMTRIWNWQGKEYRQIWTGSCGANEIQGTWKNTFDALSGTFSISYF